MSKKLSNYLQLSKAGDVASLLPILQNDFTRTGIKPGLIVSREYAQNFDTVPFIELIVYPGSWGDLPGAILWAKKHYSNVIIAQAHAANDYPIQRNHPSWQLDQWNRCGRLSDWGKLPLDLPRNPKALECMIPKPFILLADHSQSSPFEHIEDLYGLLKTNFPSHSIVRLSSIRVAQLLDLLVIYDAAELLVTIDTMHLHLSMASKTPVIALATDTPGRWRGSAWHPRFVMHLRYGEYQLRKEQLLEAAKRAVNKTPAVVAHKLATPNKYGYNLSILKAGDKSLLTYRHHPSEKSWRTEIGTLDGIPVRFPEKYINHSQEDARLWMFQGKPHISATIGRSAKNGEKMSPCITGYGELLENGTVKNWVEPQVPLNDWNHQTKNLVFFEHENKLYCIYQCSPESRVFHLDGKGNVIQQHVTKSPACVFGDIRGGTQPFPFEGNFIRFVHANQINKKSDMWWQYHVAAIVMESKPPFQILKISKTPILSGNEEYFPGHKYWKPKVCICYGAIEEDGGWGVALGINDSASAIAHITPAMLNL